MQQATLPIGMLVTANASAGTKTAYFKCATVQAEAGALKNRGYVFATPETQATAGNGTRVPLISIRPKLTYNSIPNRELLIAQSFSIFNT